MATAHAYWGRLLLTLRPLALTFTPQSERCANSPCNFITMSGAFMITVTEVIAFLSIH